MNREIKFRAWDKEKKKMVTDFVLAPTSPLWSPFHYFTHTGIEKVRELLHSAFAFDPGLRDKIDPENQILSFITSDYTWFDWADYYGSEYLTLMQYTGLKDKNGKEIYEGDILQLGEEKAVYWVVVEDGRNDFPLGWTIRATYPQYMHPSVERLAIIGNVYENPELLK